MFRIPSPATCIATVALLFAVTGTAAASGLITGAQIKDNTVGSPDIRNNSIATQDVKNNSMTSLDVLDGTLKANDFAPGVLTSGSAGPAGPAGPAGAPGATGAAGPQGAPGVSGLEIVNASSVSNSLGTKFVTATCPAGKSVVGGGARILNAASFAGLDESYPSSATAWTATAYEINPTGGNWSVTAFAVCGTVA